MPEMINQKTAKKNQADIDVSIVIVNWNTKKMLLECIQSLKEQTNEIVMEIIVIDNASADGSPEAVKNQFPDVHVIVNDSNLGFAKANNIGIKIARGRYVTLVNSDILALDSILDKMTAYMDKHPEIGGIGPKTIDGNHNMHLDCREIPNLRNSACDYLHLRKIFKNIHNFRGREFHKKTYHYTHPVGVLSGCFLMVRQEALQQVGLLDERFFFYREDVDWCKRLWDTGWKVIFFPEAVAIHYGGASSTAAPLRFVIENEKASLQYWQKYHNRFERLVYLALKAMYRFLNASGWLIVYLLTFKRRKLAAAKLRNNSGALKWLLTRSWQYLK